MARSSKQTEQPSGLTRKRKRRRSWLRYVLFGVAMLAMVGMIYVTYIGVQVWNTWDAITEIDANDGAYNDEDADPPREVERGEPFTMLLLGTDEEDVHDGRSDMIMVAVVDPDKEEVTLVSIPRDTRTTLVGCSNYIGCDQEDKINHAYRFGGKQMAIDTVSNFLDIDIDYFVAVNFQAVIDFVDMLGGLEVDSEREIQYVNSHGRLQIDIPQGPTVLNGDEALYYARFRQDAEGDFGRNRRQQQIVREMVDQALSFRNITRVGDILDIVEDNVRLDIPRGELVNMLRDFSSLRAENIDSILVQGENRRLEDGYFYVIVSEEDQLEVQQELDRRMNRTMAEDGRTDDESETTESKSDLSIGEANPVY